MQMHLIRRGGAGVLTLFGVSLVTFLLFELAPGDPLAHLSRDTPDAVLQEMRARLGTDQAALHRFSDWFLGLFWIEPLLGVDALLGTGFADPGARIISLETSSPVMDLILERLPQTLSVVGLAYLIGVLLAFPMGVFAAYRRGAAPDHLIGFASLAGYAIPPFLSGLLLIQIFAVKLGWLPSVYDTTHEVTDWASLKEQFRQMLAPVLVLSLQTTAQINRFIRGSVLETLHQDYVRTARAKGAGEPRVFTRHILRNALVPVVVMIALTAPGVFGGAVITEQVFRINGIGALLISSINASDGPMAWSLIVIFGALVILCNLVADVVQGLLDPRLSHD